MSEEKQSITKRFRAPEASKEDWDLITNPGMRAVLGAVVGKQNMHGKMSIGAILAAILAGASYLGIKPPWQTADEAATAAAKAAAAIETLRTEEKAEHKEMMSETKKDIQILGEKIDQLPNRLRRR